MFIGLSSILSHYSGFQRLLLFLRMLAMQAWVTHGLIGEWPPIPIRSTVQS